MKYYKDNFVDYCNYCKEEINSEQGFVYRKGKLFHLECYHLIIDCPLDLEDEDLIE